MEMQFRTQNQISSSPVFWTLPLSPWEENATSFYLLFNFHSISSCCKIIQRWTLRKTSHSDASTQCGTFSTRFILIAIAEVSWYLKTVLHRNCCNHVCELFRTSCFSIPPPLCLGSQNFPSSQWSRETLKSYPGCLHAATWDPNCFWEMRLKSLRH